MNRVVGLQDAVFAKVSCALRANVLTADLVVFTNREAYEAKKQELSISSSSLTDIGKDMAGALAGNTLIGSLGGSMEDALIVQVPSYRQVGIVRKERELEEEEASVRGLKKARVEDNDLVIRSIELVRAMHKFNLDAIFAIESVVELPFPSLLTQTNSFQINERVFLRIKVKSCVAMVEPAHYYSECGGDYWVWELLPGEGAVVAIMKKNILLNMPSFIGLIDTITDVRTLLRGQMVILVADQLNSIDDEDTRCQAARKHLASCLGTSIFVKIHGMSMDAKTYRTLLPRQTSADNNIYNGGFNADEFSTWLHHHPAIFTQHKDELALMSVFARAYNGQDSWEDIVQSVQLDDNVEDWRILLADFYEDIDGDQVWKVLKLSVVRVLDSDIVDFRFFYQDRKLGFCATNDIVLRLLYQVWSKKSADRALLTRWSDILFRSRSLSGVGFEIIKAQICLQGVVGKYPRPKDWAIKRTRFVPGKEKPMLKLTIEERGGGSWWILLDPVISNYAGVDMILVTDTELVGISVTIAKTHTPLTPFFKLWGELAKLNNLAIKGLFVAPDNFVNEEENIDTSFFEKCPSRVVVRYCAYFRGRLRDTKRPIAHPIVQPIIRNENDAHTE